MEKIEYSVSGVRELLSKPDLTPDEMASHKVYIVVHGRSYDWADYLMFNSCEIDIEFMLRAVGYQPGKEKELKRHQLLREEGKEGMIEFWEKAMKEDLEKC